MIVGCPSLNCASGTAKNFHTLRHHMATECISETLNCKGCGFSTFKHYSQVASVHNP